MNKSTLNSLLALPMLLILITACGSEAPAPTSVPTRASFAPTQQPATSVSTNQASQIPTTVPVPTNAPSTAAVSQPPTVISDSAIPSGTTADGFYYLGNPDARVTLIDYSDFL